MSKNVIFEIVNMNIYRAVIKLIVGSLGLISVSQAQVPMPSSGSCALLLTLPVPYGANVTSFGETGYNMIGRILFTSATTGSLSGRIVNPTYQQNNSPYILSKNIFDFENIPLTVEMMTSANGFVGGYKITGNSRLNGRNFFIELTAVASNNGKSIVLVSSGAGTTDSPGLGPASGVCQF